MESIFLHSYTSASGFPHSGVKLNIYFISIGGDKYVWTPDWKRETMQLFIEAYRLEELVRKQSLHIQQREEAVKRITEDERTEKEVADFEILAFKAGEALRRKASIPQIKKVASQIFLFDVTYHPNSKITDINAQKIYDCIMTLGEQPYTRLRKLVLVKKFVAAVAPAHHPLRSVA